MFLDFHKLKEQPFGVTPDPRFLFLSTSHAEALASLYYGIEERRGFMTLIADPGMGKTTLLFQLMNRLKSSTAFAFIFQTQCDSRELLRYLLMDLGVDAAGDDLVSMHTKLNQQIVRMRQARTSFVLIVDEAQNLDEPVLETIRLLSDFETPRNKLIQIVLAGQPQLKEKLAQPSLAQLRQRVSMFANLRPLSGSESVKYIHHRLKIAGGNGQRILTPAASGLLAQMSGGIPRIINALCFNSLSVAFARGRHVVDESIVHEAAADLSFDPPPETRVANQPPPFEPPVEIGSTVRETATDLSFRRPRENRPVSFNPLVQEAARALGSCAVLPQRVVWALALSAVALALAVAGSGTSVSGGGSSKPATEGQRISETRLVPAAHRKVIHRNAHEGSGRRGLVADQRKASDTGSSISVKRTARGENQ